MTYDSEPAWNSKRSEIKRAFDFGNLILKVYDLQSDREELVQKIKELDRRIDETRQQLPPEVYKLYEEQQIVDKLKGT